MAMNKLPWPLKGMVIYFICVVLIAILRVVWRFPDYRSLIDIIVYGIMTFGILKRLEAARKWIPVFIALHLAGFVFGLSTGNYSLTMSRYVRWGGNALIHSLILIYLLWSPRAKEVLSKKLGSTTRR
jgi:TRAP-type uncharacterized transport system fused permease subunit